MVEYLLESLENGSHGIIPSEGLNYFVGSNRITVHKDGKKIIDKEIRINPDGTISKYNLVCDDDKEPELNPVTDVEEYNVANMLPQVYPEGTVLKKDVDKDIPEIINTKESDDLSIEKLKNGVSIIFENCDNILDNIINTTIDESAEFTDGSVIMESDNIVTEDMVDHVNSLAEKECDKVMSRYRSYCVKEIRAIDGISKVTEDNYKGYCINIKINNKDIEDHYEFLKDEVFPVLDFCTKEFSKKYNCKFSWKDTIVDNNEFLITLDSDIYYKYRESTCIDDDCIAKNDAKKIIELAKEKIDLFKSLEECNKRCCKNDVKKKLVKNQIKFRDIINSYSDDFKDDIKEIYSNIDESDSDIDDLVKFIRKHISD